MAVDFIAASAARRKRGSWFRYDLVGPTVAASDFTVIVAASLLGGVFFTKLRGDGPLEFANWAALGALFGVLFVLLMQQRAQYRPLALLQPRRQLSSILALWGGIACFLTVIGFALKAGHMVSRGASLSFLAFGLVGVIASRFGWTALMRRALADRRFAPRRIALIADKAWFESCDIARDFSPFGISVVAQVRLPFNGAPDSAAVTELAPRIIAGLRGSLVEEVIVVAENNALPSAEQLIGELRILPLPVKLMFDRKLSELVKRPILGLGNDLVAVEMHRPPMTLGERAGKRMLDLAIAAPALILVAPLLVMTALAIRIDSPGPVLFRQTRNGFNNRPFKILKFRSMSVMEDGGAVLQASRGDRRVTAVGRWIRKLSIDELPQLWNVLRGEMSLVGPRPHALAHDEHYEKLIGDYPYRQHVKPGLTGWAQINGSRGETPTIESMAERVRLDLWYVENVSVWLDIRIIVRTFLTLLNVKQTY